MSSFLSIVMSPPIILKAMGKLKFTFTNLWYYLLLILTCTLTENIMHMASNAKGGFNITGLFVISLACVACLFMFFFISHKENKLKVDVVLLPAIVIVGICFLIPIWLNKGMTATFANGEGEIVVTYSLFERIRASVILVIFLATSYAMLFATRVHGFRNKTIYFIALVGIGAALLSLTYSLIVERQQYMSIFKDDAVQNVVIDSFYGNKNYYGGVLLIGFLSCIVANYYKPRFTIYFLMIVFVVGIIACAAMLPSIIAFVALPLYLLEEIVRFSIKKRWLYVVFTMLAIFIFLGLIILFYYGVTHFWKGFAGLDAYLSETFHKKNFSTFSGRTKIWAAIFPHCFENPLQLILGHGFMLSEKNILAITSAMNDGANEGVRTAHNGYLQILYEYGIVGAVVHLALLGVFLYSCFRMLLEKKFHFVFIYLLIGLCAATYNFCESSSYFDAGTKEMFMTQLFVMPVITEAKLVSKTKKHDEMADFEQQPKRANSISLGKAVALVIMGLIFTLAISFLSSTTYQTLWIRNMVLNLLVYLGIALLFVPYLITLYHRKTDYFILHLVFNFLFIGLLLFVFLMFANKSGMVKPVIPYVMPVLLFFALLVEVVFYAFIKQGNIKEWAIVTFGGAFAMPRYAFIGAALVGGIGYLSLTFMGKMTMFVYFMLMIITVIAFFGTYYFLPTKAGKQVRANMDYSHMNAIKRDYIYNETYYG